jgi:hypothetical protein
MRGTSGSDNANANHSGQADRTRRAEQNTNQAQAAQHAGRGSRTITSRPATTRTRPSQTF